MAWGKFKPCSLLQLGIKLVKVLCAVLVHFDGHHLKIRIYQKASFSVQFIKYLFRMYYFINQFHQTNHSVFMQSSFINAQIADDNYVMLMILPFHF